MKRNYVKKIALLLGITCAINLPQTTFASFNDISNHWAKDAINRIEGFKLINGFEGSFRPNSYITGGELAVILDRIMDYQNKVDNSYKDLDNNFYTDSILKLTKAGVMNGSNNEIRPKDYISREEAATMIARAYSYYYTTMNYTDISNISDWAISSVSALTQEGFISGDNGLFRPKDYITRAEVVTILNNILGGYYKNEGPFSEQSTDKSVVVSSSDVKLENMTIEKDLIITAGVGEGDVTLSNVNVKGKTLIYGGGSHSIYIEGNSSLGKVELAKEGEPIRIVSKDNAKIENIILREQNANTIIEGKVDIVESRSSNKQIEIRGQVDTLVLKGKDTNVNLTKDANIQKVSINDKATNNNFQLEKGSNIKSLETYSNVNIKGDGNISNIQALTDGLSISKPDGMKTEIKTPSSSEVTGGGSSSSGNNSGNNNNNNNNGNNNQNQKPKIVSVESVKNGLVRFKLDKPFDGILTKDMISIICTSGGSDMTVLNVNTSDNITFDVTTAYYKDNSYSLGITFKDGTIIEKAFEVRALAPVISSVKVERNSNEKANVLYVSDTPGKFYYILKENANTRTFSSSEITEDEVVKNGNALNMSRGGNSIEITNLQKYIGYTMYYVAEDFGGNRTTLKQVDIPTKADIPESNVQILNAEGFYENKGFFEENHWFKFKLSEPVELELKDFSISCPTDGKLTLGRLETEDNINYTIYMKKGYVPSSDNTYTVDINLPDGNTITKSFFVDFVEPIISGLKAVRIAEDKAEITFNSDEAGILYWKVLPLEDVPQDTSPKDPSVIMNGGTKSPLYAAGNKVTLEEIGAKDQVFCYVSQDEKRNFMEYYGYIKIPNDITSPEVPDPENELKFTVTEVGTTKIVIGDCTYIKIQFTEVGRLEASGVTVENKKTGASYSGEKAFDRGPDGLTLYYRGGLLPSGEYTLTIVDGDKKGSADFTVE